MKTQKQITLIGLGIIASIIMVPFIYAAVEPHILLTMDAAQTTKPFVINNSTNDEVFSIDTDGSMNGRHHLTYTSGLTPIISVAVGNDPTDAIPMALWQLTRTETEPYIVMINDPTVVLIGQRETGASGCAFGWMSATSLASLTSLAEQSFTYASWADDNTNTGETFMSSTDTYLGLFFWNADGATSCSYRSVSASIGLVLPDSITITRVL